LKDGGQVNQGAHAGQPPNAGRGGVEGRGIRQAWAVLSGRIGSAVAALPLRTALPSRLVAAPSAWLPRAPLPSGLRRGLDLILPMLRRLLKAAALALAIVLVTILALVVAYRWINPPLSTLMLGQSIAGTSIERTWVPLDRVSPQLIRAVVMSEDGRFCTHGGVDWRALQDAIAHDRGGSTITMQVVKNLFLWPSRSYVRKAVEIALAYLVEALWPKRRILEIYLNIAEWGDGVFGVEAAAQTHFSKPAAQLTAEEAALLAVVLPSPLERSPGQPNGVTSRLAGRLMLRMSTSRVDLACVRSGSWARGGLQSKPAPQPVAKHKTEERPTSKAGPNGGWDHLFPSTD
jgi:monofunctional biosynthetic peptidoglycan transglycosylase